MEELSMLDVYNKCLDKGDSKKMAIDTIIDFWTTGMSAFWDKDKWDKVRQIVQNNIDNQLSFGA